MSNKRAPGRSLEEWMELVTECRQSGLTDAAWCNEHGISPSCFYNAVTRLRKKVNNPGPGSLLSGDRKPQIRFLGNHHSGSGNLYHKSFRM